MGQLVSFWMNPVSDNWPDFRTPLERQSTYAETTYFDITYETSPECKVLITLLRLMRLTTNIHWNGLVQGLSEVNTAKLTTSCWQTLVNCLVFTWLITLQTMHTNCRLHLSNHLTALPRLYYFLYEISLCSSSKAFSSSSFGYNVFTFPLAIACLI